MEESITENYFQAHFFRDLVHNCINLHDRLQTPEEINAAVHNIQTVITEAAWAATPTQHSTTLLSYPHQVVQLIRQRRAAWHRWQQTHSPADKHHFNQLCKEVKKLTAEIRSKSFDDFLHSLDTTADANYSLWKIAKATKKQPSYTPPLRSDDGTKAYSDTQKAVMFANYLETVFQPNKIDTDV